MNSAILVLAILSGSARADESLPHLLVPPGFTIEKVAAPPLVEHPMMGGFDERGRLFLADAAGRNLKKDDLLKEFPNRIRVLEPAGVDGRFTQGRIWADKMTFPMGALWHRGALFSGSPPSLWKLEEDAKTGLAGRRSEFVSRFGFTGNAADIHGPFLGPDGWLYWCDGRHGHEIMQPSGQLLKGKAARIFRCKTDGTGVEVVCGGGMDNPVEVAFTAEGEPLATVAILHTQPSRNDAIIFCIEGGVYPWHDVYKEFPRTGDLLPPVESLGWVAPSGLMRYQSTGFGKDYQDNFFSTQFNRGKVQRHVLIRDGAGFRMKTEDFLTSTDRNFHPTDVLEDADGSLLVIDTGGWFRIGCPTSKIAQPEIKGAVYRIRKKGVPPVVDPRGLKLNWPGLSPDELAKLLDDERWMVRERAIDTLAWRGQKALPALAKLVAQSRSTRACRNAVWALCRMEGEPARALVRRLIPDQDASVRLAAMHAAGLHRDAKAITALQDRLGQETESAAGKRQAATALGRLRLQQAAPALLEALAAPVDRFLEHALIFALMQCNDRDSLARSLHSRNPRLQRGALIALDQLADSPLTAEQVAPLLASADPALRQATLDVVARRPAWGSLAVEQLRRLSQLATLEKSEQDLLLRLVMGLCQDAALQKEVPHALSAQSTSLTARLTLLDAVAGVPLAKLPPTWAAVLVQALADKNQEVVLRAIAAQRAHLQPDFIAPLTALATNDSASAPVRIAAFAAVSDRLKSVDQALFRFLTDHLGMKEEPLRRLAIAGALSKAPLDNAQKHSLIGLIPAAGALELPQLLAALDPLTDLAAGRRLLQALRQAPGKGNLSPALVQRTFAGLPALKVEAAQLALSLAPDAGKQQARLKDLEPLMTGGDPARGHDVFFGNKAACSSCHALNNKGGHIGPDLGKIGAIRTSRDLLESIVFPSSSFARGFEPLVLVRKSGTVVTGILASENAEAVTLITTERHHIRVPRHDIEDLAPGSVSVMPQGMDGVLGRDELRHLLAFLQNQR